MLTDHNVLIAVLIAAMVYLVFRAGIRAGTVKGVHFTLEYAVSYPAKFSKCIEDFKRRTESKQPQDRAIGFHN